MNEPRDQTYFQHILDAVGRVAQYIEGSSIEAFREDQLVQDAVIRQLQISGEAPRRLSSEFQSRHSDMPWHKIKGMRDKLVTITSELTLKRCG